MCDKPFTEKNITRVFRKKISNFFFSRYHLFNRDLVNLWILLVVKNNNNNWMLLCMK